MKFNEWLVDSEYDVIKSKRDTFSGWSWLGDLSLGGDSLSLNLGLVLEFIILLDSVYESSSAVGYYDVFSEDVNSLLNESTVV